MLYVIYVMCVQVSKLKKKLLASEEALHKAQEEAEHAHTQATKAQAHAHQVGTSLDMQ